MKLTLSLLSLLLVSACVLDSSTIKPMLVKTKPTVYIPDNSFFYCPSVDKLPDVSTLTDSDVAKLLIQLDTNNSVCKKSMVALKDELLKAQQRLGG